MKFPSKLLAIHADKYIDASGNTILVAEADGGVSAFDVSTKEISRVGRPADAPMTCVVAYAGQQSMTDSVVYSFVFGGGWNKYITSLWLAKELSFNPSNITQKAFKAHADFVKCLLVARTPDKRIVLLSGGADGDLNIWSFEGQRLARVQPQSRGIECIAIDPHATSEEPRIFFSTSQREIYSFVLPSSDSMKNIVISESIIQHETSVYKLEFDGDGDLWTASADKTAKRLVREDGFVADTTLVHPDFVRDIVIYEPSSLAITACRDEEVRVWNTGSGQLLHIFSGHFEEVTGLALVGSTLLSISIDATLRRWSLAPQDLKAAIEEVKNPKLLEQEPEPKTDIGGLTEEEEAELRAMMEEEEAENLEKMVLGEQ